MKTAFLATLIAFILPVITSAQQPDTTSACLKAVPPGVLLNICEHEHGMAPLPQPRLYLRIYKDGRGEYEASKRWNALTKQSFRVKEEDISEIVRLGATDGVQKALEKYPAYQTGIDSWREITVDVYAETGQKRVILNNFFAADRENKKHYPASLISLMELVEDMRHRANGTVRRLIEWTNEDKFQELRRSGRKYITFRVVSKETQQMTRYRWSDVYTCEIVTITEELNKVRTFSLRFALAETVFV